jgi:putative protease
MKEVPTLFDIGVDSLKIEGRLKTEYYLATIVNAYRHALDDYEKDPENWSFEKYFKEMDKAKTRGLTEFYFDNKANVDTQDLEGKQINPDYEFGGMVVSTDLNGVTTVEIRNKLSVGDKLEIMLPEKLEPYTFNIEKLYDVETGEEIITTKIGTKYKENPEYDPS